MNEIERLKTALALTREHNVRLAEENRRLRAALGLPTPEVGDVPAVNGVPPAAPRTSEPVIVRVHPLLMPPPPPVETRATPTKSWRPRRRDLYEGDKPLRSRWPIET